MKGELEKRINKMLELSTVLSKDKDMEYQQKRTAQIINEVRKELVEGSYKSWVALADEPKPAIRYVCIEYDKFLKWFGDE